jgi:hypothetical protein
MHNLDGPLISYYYINFHFFPTTINNNNTVLFYVDFIFAVVSLSMHSTVTVRPILDQTCRQFDHS